MHTALSVICPGHENTGRFSEAEPHYIFLSAALTEEEISEGIETYANLEELLADQMVRIEIDEELT